MTRTSIIARLSGFAKPWRSQFRSFAFRWLRFFPFFPLPFRLPFGAWWLLRNDQIAAALLEDSFENAEHNFTDGFLQPGMTVLDIGANQGYYTLFASRKVGPQGRIFAFEPSPREVRRLKLHLWLNRCKNVELSTCALGTTEGTGTLHVVLGTESGCNSLRPPVQAGETSPASVRINSLDQWLEAHQLKTVDFIKLDVEGGELAVLQGAEKLLARRPRPVILAEVQDIRTQPWGYRASEIIRYLSAKNYKWFSLSADGTPSPLNIHSETFDGNFVAWPSESEPLLGL